MNGVEAQHLTIRLLSLLSADEIMAVVEKIERKGCPTDVKLQFKLCNAISGKLKKEPKCYDTLERICKDILNNQNRGTTTILKKDYRIALGLSSEMQLNRIEKGTASLRMEHIKNICDGFETERQKRFWENQLLYLYPNIVAPERPNETEYLCLSAVYEMLSAQQRDFVEKKLDFLEKDHIEALRKILEKNNKGENRQENSKLGKPPYRLYAIINKNALECRKIITDIAEDELGISTNTWYSWKNAWEHAEGNKFSKGVPRSCFSRIDIMILAVLFDFTYSETVVFMALMGYRFSMGKPDEYVVKYLMKKENKDAEEMKLYLQKGKITSDWKTDNKNWDC